MKIREFFFLGLQIFGFWAGASDMAEESVWKWVTDEKQVLVVDDLKIPLLWNLEIQNLFCDFLIKHISIFVLIK